MLLDGVVSSYTIVLCSWVYGSHPNTQKCKTFLHAV